MRDGTSLPAELRRPYNRLCRELRRYGSLLVAYSGGVDSGVLTFVARGVLGDRMLPVIGVSPSLPEREEAAALEFLASHGIPCERIETAEIENEDYTVNSADRCYFCKSELFSKLRELARERGLARIAYGENLDDRGDHRPGARAASEGRVVIPLADAGLTKRMVRELARALDLVLWDKPASPCLASRVPYFEPITVRKLAQIEGAENILKDLGFGTCRVRHFGTLARIEVPATDHWRIQADEVWREVVAGVKRAGFERVTLAPDGFRSGRLNDILKRT